MLTSCDLDTIPTTYVDAGSVFGKTGDAEKVLNGGWNYLMETFNSYANPGYGAMLRANDAMGSDVVLNTKYGFRAHNEFTAIYGKGGTNTLSWLLAYRVINDCNGVLDNIDAAEGTQIDRNRIKGQALALRGFLYLHLASCYSFAIDKDPDAVCAPIYTQSTDETKTNDESKSNSKSSSTTQSNGKSSSVAHSQSSTNQSQSNSGQTSNNQLNNSSTNSSSNQQPTNEKIAINIQVIGMGNTMMAGTLNVDKNSNALSVLKIIAAKNGKEVEGSDYYVSGIGGLKEKQHGPMSGWMYSVNGVAPNKAAIKYDLKDGDKVVWYYVNYE